MEEIHNYPFDPVIKFKQQGRSFSYKIIKEDASNLFHKHYTLQKGTKMSGIYLFGLQLKILDKTRDRKQCAHVLKQVNQCSNTTLTRRATSIGKQLLIEFNEKVPKFYNVEEIPVLENIRYSVKNRIFDIHYGDEDKIKEKQKIESVVRALDEGNISRNPYRCLCAIESHLPREGVVSKKRQRINEEMAQLIPISIVDINA
ncbi:hypothetical protein RhiirA4_418453 [Rhizophagus irregularis]|uniref:Uncharacterized protein n=1 Tax=Rhizophagus irregularis TaxID=588596 RepID=A0A2I1GAN5_9GLOM|nr:hypothetical protein RhiirA4_418453 [Rhizophagus irregularis]